MLAIVDDSFELSSQNATLAEKIARADAWARVLFGIVPDARLEDAFDRAFRDHASPFPVNAYEIKQAWERIASEEAAEDAAALKREMLANPVKFCENKANHLGADGTILKVNPFDTTQDITVPCWSCRRRAHDDVWERFLDQNGRRDLPPLEMVKQIAQLAPEAEPEAETLPAAEIAALTAEHNALVNELTDEDQARRALYLDYDDGANCFVRANYRSRTFSPEIVRKTIADYKRLIVQNEAAFEHFAN